VGRTCRHFYCRADQLICSGLACGLLIHSSTLSGSSLNLRPPTHPPTHSQRRYTGEHLIAKNRDLLPDAISACFHSSTNTLVKGLFADGASAEAAGPKRQTRRSKRRAPRAQKPTVSTQFTRSLELLVAQMNACAPHFVRCIKPNGSQAPRL
jgi:hypothetical protein